MWRGTGSLPEGQATCRPCRNAQPEPVRSAKTGTITSQCAACGSDFTYVKRTAARILCPSCRKARRLDRERKRDERRRSTPDVRARRARLNHQRRSAMTGGETFAPTEIADRDGWRCGICHQPIRPDLAYPHRRSLSIDHLVPVSQGGPHTRANVQATHLACNASKNARPIGEQLRLIG